MGLEIANIKSYTKYVGATKPRTTVGNELLKFYNGDKTLIDSFVKSITKPKTQIPSFLISYGDVKKIIKGGEIDKYVGGAKPIWNFSIDWNELFTQTMKLVKKIK